MSSLCSIFFFFFNDTATTEIYTLSLHDALPIYRNHPHDHCPGLRHRLDRHRGTRTAGDDRVGDRKSTRLNSSHTVISYAVFCLKKKKKTKIKRKKLTIKCIQAIPPSSSEHHTQW